MNSTPLFYINIGLGVFTIASAFLIPVGLFFVLPVVMISWGIFQLAIAIHGLVQYRRWSKGTQRNLWIYWAITTVLLSVMSLILLELLSDEWAPLTFLLAPLLPAGILIGIQHGVVRGRDHERWENEQLM